ncbi:hypothetical protein OPQ81_002911 [Rhizoctonia solani]|nr:hypothetical protein OPQ81_002911 [Rhizoctonia solani]
MTIHWQLFVITSLLAINTEPNLKTEHVLVEHTSIFTLLWESLMFFRRRLLPLVGSFVLHNTHMMTITLFEQVPEKPRTIIPLNAHEKP